MSHSISAILPNYNGRNLLEKNIPSLLKAIAQFEYEIIVIDDCSTDDSVQFLEQNHPNIIIIRSEINQGFSSSCNKGINIASKELICIANTDVTFTENYFTNAMQSFTEADVFAVKGDIINFGDNFDDVKNIERTSLLYYKRGFLRFNQKIEPSDEPLSSEINKQFILLGCCFVCKKESLQALKGYDEIYSPFYWEDADLAHRALQSGYQLKYNPECKVYHQLSATISHHHSKRKRRLLSYRNKFLFTWRHLSGISNWISHLFYTLLNLMTRWIILDWKYYVAFVMAMHSIITKSLFKRN